MDATQMISDSILESDEEGYEEKNDNNRGDPLAKLCILKNEHIPETELPLFLGDNVLGRDPNTCTLPLSAPSISKQHATIYISVYRKRDSHREMDIEALVWDLGSMNGTRKGRLKLTPEVRYALSDGDSLVVADIPCQYVSCAVNTVSSQGNMRTPVSRKSSVKARLPDTSEQKGSDTGSKKCVNGGTKARLSQTKTPLKTSCLSFEQTPTQPQGTLVPESDSESEDERQGGGPRMRKTLVSDSDSHKSSPTCSTFLSPINKIVPESEDESPITPSSSTKNRPYRDVSLSKEETEVDMGRQELMQKQALAILDNSEEEQGTEEERLKSDGIESVENGQHVPTKYAPVIPTFNMDSDTDVDGDEEGVASAGPVTLNTNQVKEPPHTGQFHVDSDTDVEEDEEGVASAGPVTLNTNQVKEPPHTGQFHMDSDTDVEEDEEGVASAGPVTLNTNQVKEPPNTGRFHMDSDTDVDEDAPKTVPSSDDIIKPSHVISVIQPEAMNVDSDTYVENDAAGSDAAKSAYTADSVHLVQPNDFCLDSDTDADDEEEMECVKTKSSSKMDASHAGLDVKSIGPDSTPAASHSLHRDSDTDDEAIPPPALSEPMVMFAATESCTTADKDANLDILPDSDTDEEDDSPLVIPIALSTLSVSPTNMPETLQSDSDADTDMDEFSVPPAGGISNPASLRVDSGTDLANKESDIQDVGADQIPDLCREQTPGLLLPLLQNCSTPVQVSEGEVENMETQAFLSPSVPVRRLAAPAIALSSCSEEEDFVVAETQSFVLQTRDCPGNPAGDHIMDHNAFGLEPSDDEKDEQSSNGRSFQLGLSDSSHLQCQAQALAFESTQAFDLVDRNVKLEDTQAYADSATGENAPILEATQAYGVNEEPAGCSVMSEKEGQVDLALEATQAYLSETYSDSENETDIKNSSAEAQPLYFPTSSTLAMAETQPVSVFKEEESLATDKPSSSSQQVKSRNQNEKEEGGKDEEVAQLQERLSSEALSIAETQPLQTCQDEESNNEHSVPQMITNAELSAVETQPMVAVEDGESDEDLIPDKRKRKAKPLQLEEEQTQALTDSELSVMETQPVHIGVPEILLSGKEESGKKESDFEPDEEKTPTIINSDLSIVETQPMNNVEESEEEVTIAVSRKRRAKPLLLEETQPLSNSERMSSLETQPMGAYEDEESSDEDLFPGPRKTKAKPLKSEDEQTQPLTNSVVETQPTVMCEDKEISNEELIPGSHKRKANALQMKEEETRSFTNPEVSNVEASVQPEKVTEGQSEPGPSGDTVRVKRGTQKKIKEEDKQAKCSGPLKIQIRGKGKALSNSRGRRGKSRLDEDESEVAKEVEQSKRTTGKKYVNQQKDKEQEERNEHFESKSLIREKHEGRVAEENNVAALRQEESEKMEKEQREAMEEQERLRAENAEKIRLEEEKAEKERKEQEEKSRYEQIKKEKEEQLERERRENEEKEKRGHEKAEREEKEKMMRKEQEEKERLDTEKRELEKRLEREREEQEHKEKLEREERERLEKETDAKEKQVEEKQENKEEGNMLKVPTRAQRAARRTVATQPEQFSTISTSDDVPARRTRSRSNSSNSVSSERSASSINTQESRGRGRGRGRGVKRTSEPQTASARSRRRTVAAETSQQDCNDNSPQERRSRSNSSSSLNTDISSCSAVSQTRGRGGRQRGRGKKTEPDSISPVNSKSDQNSASKPSARGRKSRKAEELSNEDCQQATTTRERQRASAHGSKSAAPDEEEQSNQEGCYASEESPLIKRNVRGRGQIAAESGTLETPGVPVVSEETEAKDKRIGRKRELVQNTTSSSSKISGGKEKAQTTKDETKDENPVQAKRRARVSSAQAKKNTKESPPKVEVKEESENMELQTVGKRARGRPSAAQKKQKVEQEDSSGTSVSSMSQDAGSQPHTPTSSVSRKRQTSVDSCPVAKTPRSSSASPAGSGRLRMASQGYKVLFTGVVDEAGERVLTRLGGSIAKGVADMNCLVTDKVRRTVKFLCALAKGIPIVTTHWLEKSGKAGYFLPPNAFVVKDPEQEKKFSFSLEESLRTASSQPLLQGYEIHFTKSVKPEPVHMKDIISCSGATFLPRMPSSHKPQTVVISCEEDWLLCGPAVSAFVPVVTAEFILTGILQQKLDFQTHTLSAPATNPQPAGGRGRGRKKT
ncbi:mediator of DNA damage checkpoint protein 1 [Anabas testudineus]|uniref:mediator of DNA damage checkpoint protein 1 n=1 Tax=Anabas testudineus TaxID=64144 RepID=UPI000E46010D|nr:mediator of DNA damage checkpoint protein 1 [Anabas testudineus]XP_026226273.1 mediator of DNA damage checkpoint protein 1 [Anabas testudineus]XP_026226274.1 mediator of DNA damage checkpoint protein 1 [Anabas testudineus]